MKVEPVLMGRKALPQERSHVHPLIFQGFSSTHEHPTPDCCSFDATSRWS